MKEIPLTQGKITIVDDDDYEWLIRYKWYYFKGYAYRNVGVGKYKQKPIPMHRDVARTPDGMETDHINLNKLDNRKENLRHCTHTQNAVNRKPYKNNRCGYKGVRWMPVGKKWNARINIGGRCIDLGRFSDISDAAKAYDEAAKVYFGEFAYLNFPDDHK